MNKYCFIPNCVYSHGGLGGGGGERETWNFWISFVLCVSSSALHPEFNSPSFHLTQAFAAFRHELHSAWPSDGLITYCLNREFQSSRQPNQPTQPRNPSIRLAKPCGARTLMFTVKGAELLMDLLSLLKLGFSLVSTPTGPMATCGSDSGRKKLL